MTAGELATMLARLRSVVLNHLVELGKATPRSSRSASRWPRTSIVCSAPTIRTPYVRRPTGPRLPPDRPGRRRNPASRAGPGRPGAAIRCRSSRHPRLAEQSRQRLPGDQPGRRRHPLVRAERDHVRAAAQFRSSQDPGLAAQPRPRPRGVGAGRPRHEITGCRVYGLLPLDRLEKRLEVALAEPLRAVPLDQLEEDRRPVLHRLGEDLQQVAVLVPVGQDAQLA